MRRFFPDIRPVDAGRRRLLTQLAAGPALFAGASLVRAADLAADVLAVGIDLHGPRVLSLVSTHTGERAEVRYFEGGQYRAASLQQLDHLLRDHRTGDVAQMDPKLFDQLHALALRAGRPPHYQIISGYRSPASNENLRKASTGVATRSLHMDGRAIDVRLPGCPTAKLRDLALEMKAGGVGYYAKSDFLHLDTGRVRYWTG